MSLWRSVHKTVLARCVCVQMGKVESGKKKNRFVIGFFQNEERSRFAFLEQFRTQI